jgi:hypothetical protein
MQASAAGAQLRALLGSFTVLLFAIALMNNGPYAGHPVVSS